LLDTHICYYDKLIGQKNWASVTEAVRVGVWPTTLNGKGYFNLVELYIWYDTLSYVSTYFFMKLARWTGITRTRPWMPSSITYGLEKIEVFNYSFISICRIY
jgi:hypothetical protein